MKIQETRSVARFTNRFDEPWIEPSGDMRIDAVTYYFGDRHETWLLLINGDGTEHSRVNARHVHEIEWNKAPA